MKSLNASQRIVLVVGMGLALVALGHWINHLGAYPSGWANSGMLTRVPFYTNVGGNGIHPLVRLVIWIVLIAAWVIGSIKVFESRHEAE